MHENTSIWGNALEALEIFSLQDLSGFKTLCSIQPELSGFKDYHPAIFISTFVIHLNTCKFFQR